ncbi:nuclear transport factor 2 family protein [Nocardia sp. NBC_00565]|uniref:nuclear transport factor 2 family protein n=1 Tax=Nocardia sp. NBC_00565 TaxID=2975993 RepID=UPI002E80D982|nr:nuclear transport factor 2 family protein [Nocardia sp. NBC_00565]WUC06851.1 nuclear transport factor 2 family protein [Nocardia sp. NBC_00565]
MAVEDALDVVLAERACERLIVEFVRRLDLGVPGDVAELFTKDGVWEWPEGGRRVHGRAALRDYFASRPADRLSRRVSTNILVTVDTPVSASSTSYFTPYRVDGHTGAMVAGRAPVNVGHYEDTSQNRGHVAAGHPDHRHRFRRTDREPEISRRGRPVTGSRRA